MTTETAKGLLAIGQTIRTFPLVHECERSVLGVIQEVVTASNGDTLVRSEVMGQDGNTFGRWDIIYSDCLDAYEDWPIDLIKVEKDPDGKQSLLEWEAEI